MIKKVRPQKLATEELFKEIKKSLRSAKYFFTEHAEKRSKNRKNVNQLQVIKILKSEAKFHEKKKDKIDEIHNEWNYSIRGRTIDSEEVRIILSFDEDNMLIITVINLNE